MKSSRLETGVYIITGHTKDNEMVQYEISALCEWWVIKQVYGNGPQFNGLYSTKAEALKTIRENT